MPVPPAGKFGFLAGVRTNLGDDGMVGGPQSVTVAAGLGFGDGASNQISLIATVGFIAGALVMQSI